MSATTGTQATRSCPPSSVADQIVCWDEVQDGDLVLYQGEMRAVQWIVPNGHDAMSVRLVGNRNALSVPRSTLTAVRRYDISEEQDHA